jgi:hypothetical protein
MSAIFAAVGYHSRQSLTSVSSKEEEEYLVLVMGLRTCAAAAITLRSTCTVESKL